MPGGEGPSARLRSIDIPPRHFAHHQLNSETRALVKGFSGNPKEETLLDRSFSLGPRSFLTLHVAVALGVALSLNLLRVLSMVIFVK